MNRALNKTWSIQSLALRFIVLLSTVFLAWMFWPRTSPLEPSYKGLSLTQWLEAGIQDPWNSAEAEQAIQAIGPAALPYLEKRMRANYNGVMQSVMQHSDSLGLGFAGSYYRYKGYGAGGPLGLAWFGFRALRSEGLPTLRTLLQTHNPVLIQRVAPVLQFLGPGAAAVVPELSELLQTAPDPDIRALAAHTLNFLGSNAEIAAALAAGLSDTNTQVRLNAALSLGRLEPLSFPSERAIYGGVFDGVDAQTRGGIHLAATNAVPALTKALRDPDRNVQVAARFALDQIAAVASAPAAPPTQPAPTPLPPTNTP